MYCIFMDTTTKKVSFLCEVQSLEQHRQQVLQKMSQIDHIERGTLSRQFFEVERGGRKKRLGPYFVLQKWFHGKKLSRRVNSQHVEHVRLGLRGYEHFCKLAEEFIEVTQQLTRLREQDVDSKKKVMPSPRSASVRRKRL